MTRTECASINASLPTSTPLLTATQIICGNTYKVFCRTISFHKKEGCKQIVLRTEDFTDREILTKHWVTFLHLNFQSKLCINRVLAAGLEKDLYKD